MSSEARGYSWPAFAAGHELSVKHGVGSERKLRPIVDELIASLETVAPWTAAHVFRPTVESWAYAEAQCVLFRRWFDVQGIAEGDDDPKSSGRWDKAEARASKLRAELGLSPASLTRLLSGLSAIDASAATSGLDALREAGAATRANAEAALQSGPQPPAGELERPSGNGDGDGDRQFNSHLTPCAERPVVDGCGTPGDAA